MKNLPDTALLITDYQHGEVATHLTITARGVSNSPYYASEPGEYPELGLRLLSVEPEGLKESNILGAAQVALLQDGWLLNPHEIWNGNLREEGFFQIRRDTLNRFEG